MIGIVKHYKDGLLAVWREKQLLFCVYSFNFIFAYLLALPVSMMFSQSLSETTAAEKMLEAFDYTLYIAIRTHFGQGLSLGRLLLTIGLFYVVFNLFFSGGIIYVFVSRQKFILADFLRACITYFMRFLKLFGFSLIFISLAILLYNLLSRLSGLMIKDAATEHLPLLLFILRIMILAGILIFINMLFDYAKIITVANDYTGMFKTFRIALIFISGSLVKTISLYKLYLFTAVLIFLIYWSVESFLKVSGGIMVLVFFLWTQIYVLQKLWVRLSFFSGQAAFYLHSDTALPAMVRQKLAEAAASHEESALNSDQ
jgi:hypothetical protein